MSENKLKELLIKELGDETFRRFYFALLSHDRLLFWQEKLIDQLRGKGIEIPNNITELKTRLKDSIVYKTLTENEVPSEIVIHFLKGDAPVQGEGTFRTFKWYFRARFSHWGLSISIDPNIDPLNIQHEVDGYYIEDIYGDGRYDASYMPLDEARNFIVENLLLLAEKYNFESTQSL